VAEDATKSIEHLYDVIKAFDTAMLITRAADGTLRGRPMTVADPNRNGEIYFSTSVDSPKVKELEADPRVSVTLQGTARHASVSGTARVVRDRALVEELWTESWRLWFPKGKDDPSLCLIAVKPNEGRYWDYSGARGVEYLFAAAKAYLSGKSPEPTDGQTGDVRL
jgi:general stress protein 26